MNRRIQVWILTLAALLVTACGKEVQVDTKLAIVPDNSYPEASVSSMFVAVTATYGWTLSLQFPEGTEAWATVEPTSGTGSKADVRLRFSANESESERQVTLVLTSEKGGTASAVVKQSGKKSTQPLQPQPGQEYGYGYDVAPTGLDWLELPAAKADDGREMLIHRMDGQKYAYRDKDGTRNYTCYWDYEEHLSLWVAYPLNPQLHGKGGYDYVWGFDPIIPSSLQPDITQRSYGGKGFDGKNNWNRGHQMPRADRQISQDAVSSTCYPTNMTPQDGTFNAGIWAGLESKVRNYISSAYTTDTLFVATGCLFEESTTYTQNSSGFNVKVPTHYFKALLYVGHNAAEAVEKDGTYYKAAGFLLPHDPSLPKTGILNYLMSIDELEAQTGIDFFPNLIGRLGQTDADKVEATQPGNWWK